jgi:23S rRNA (pseudouridine1915-N3)-methyltransferase
MKFVFPFLGKTREKYIDEGIKDFENRLSRFVQVDIPILKVKSPSNIPEERYKHQEAELLLSRINKPSLIVALDSSGQSLDSPGLARFIDNCEDRGIQTVYFLIGGHLGLHEDIVRQADLVLSLSKLTFTHEMSRLILLEQLYRAWMIKSGHKYHN